MMKSSYSLTNLNIDIKNKIWGFDSVTNKELGWWFKNKELREVYVKNAIKYLKMSKIDNKEVAIKLLKTSADSKVYLRFSPELRDDFSILEMQAKNNRGWYIAEASERLQNNIDIAKIIMKHNPNDIIYLDDKMKDNIDVMMTVAENEKGSQMIHKASLNILCNKNIALASVKNTPYTLIYFNNLIRDDPEVILEAIKKDRSCIIYASYRYQNFKIKYLPMWIIEKIGIENLI